MSSIRMTGPAIHSEPAERLDRLDFGLAILAIGAGSLDALGFFALGGALPSAMTGNTALLGLALGQGHPASAAPPLAAGTGVVPGVALAAALLYFGLANLSKGRAVVRLLAVEACLLAGFLLVWKFVGGAHEDLSLYLLILLAGAGMGIQSVAARQDDRPGVTTVVFTSTLTAIVISLTDAVLGSPHPLGFTAKRQVFIFLAYGAGAVTGGFLTKRAIDAMPFLPLLASLAALGLHWLSDRTTSKPTEPVS
jgi:uncharacterized membrane protein YoaK (UPF0700 family)